MKIKNTNQKAVLLKDMLPGQVFSCWDGDVYIRILAAEGRIPVKVDGITVPVVRLTDGHFMMLAEYETAIPYDAEVILR